MYQLTTGAYRDLEQTLINDLLSVRSKNPLASILLLSPSARLLSRLQSELSQRTPGLLNVHCLTFYALAERLLADSAYTETVVVEPALYAELIRNVLTGDDPEAVDIEIRKALQLEGKNIPKGLAGALAATMKDLRDAGMRADHALNATQQGFLGAEAPEAASTLALYARLVGLFEKHHLRSSADLLRRAAERAPKHPWIKEQKAIFLYGFYDLTGVQLDLVNSLADHPDARVYFPYEEGNPAYAYAEKLLKDPAFVSKYRASEHRSTAASEHRRVGGAEKSVCSDTPLLRHPDAPKPRHPDAPTHDVWSCSGPRDEVWLAAKEILKLTDDGIPFRDIAVISRNPTSYVSALREIFTANEIPYVCSVNEPAGSHPLVKTIRALVTLDKRNPGYPTVLKDLEKSPYIFPQTPSVIASSFPAAQQLTSSPTATGGGTCLPAGRSMDSSPVPAGNDVRAVWSAHIHWASNLIDQTIKLPKDATEEEQLLLNALLESLDELTILDRLGVEVSRDHFLETWDEKLEHLQRPTTSVSHDGVQVLEVQEARGLTFRAIFLLGMNEKIFPRLIREDPFLSDAARSSLAQATGSRLGRKLDGYEEERLLFGLTRNAATERLYLLTQRSDSEGKALIPSVYLKDIERELKAKPQRLPRSLLEKFEHRSPLLWTPRELSFLINRADLDPKAVYQAMGWETAGYYQLLASHRAMETFKSGIGPYDGQIQDAGALKAALSRAFSPTSLEDLAQCPFQYYAGHILHLSAEEELAPEGELAPKALGKLFHKTLELFYKSYFPSPLVGEGVDGGDKKHISHPPPQSSPTPPLQPGGSAKDAVAERGEEVLRQAIEACFNEYSMALSTVYPLVVKSVKLLIFKELLSFLKSDLNESKASGFVPTWFEQPLDGTLPIAGLAHRFYGKPDRLDVRDGEVRVVDYKSGKPKSWTGRIETSLIQGRFLQLPIYLGLAAQFASKTLGRPVTSTYATLRPVRETDEEATEKTLTASFWTSPSATLFAENLNELIKLIEKGSFYIEPDAGDWGYCARCDFALICRKEHMPSRLRAQRDILRTKVSEKLHRIAPKSAPSPLKGEGGVGGAAPHLSPPPRGGRRLSR